MSRTPRPHPDTCTRPGCDDPFYSLDLCERHYAKHRRARQIRGETLHVDVAPARSHVAVLRAHGWAWLQIAPAGRTSHMMLLRIMSGTTMTLPAHKVRRICAIPVTWKHTRVAVPIVGTQRRLSALAWQGWPGATVAAELGLSRFTFTNAGYRNNCIEARTAAKLAEFYDRYAYTPGPNLVYAKKARTLGAVPAAAWDQDIDDPDATPRGEARPAGGRPHQVRLDELEFFTSLGMSDDDIAKSMGFSVDSIQSTRRRTAARTVGSEGDTHADVA